MTAVAADDTPPAVLPTKLRWLALAGVAVVATTFGGLAAWSALAPLSSAAEASGSVVVDSNRKAIQHLIGGTVKEILVRDGDRVQAGETLIVLDDARLSVILATLQPRAWMNMAERARLMAEREAADEIRFPSELLDATNLAQQSILANERKIFVARRAELEGRLAVFAIQRKQSEALIAGLQRQLISQDQRLEPTREQLRGAERLAKKEHVARREVFNYRRAVAELEFTQSELQAKLEVEHMKLEHNSLETQRILDARAEEIETALQTVEQDRLTLIGRMQEIHQDLDRLRVVAPVAGKVVNQAVHTIGGVAAPEATLLEIVPENDPLVIEARVQPKDVEGLEPGMPVEIRFPGLREKRLPRLHGQLLKMSADRLTDKILGQDYFTARVGIDEGALKIVGPERLRPGMPVEVMLVKRPQTVFRYLMGPLDSFFARAMRE